MLLFKVYTLVNDDSWLKHFTHSNIYLSNPHEPIQQWQKNEVKLFFSLFSNWKLAILYRKHEIIMQDNLFHHVKLIVDQWFCRLIDWLTFQLLDRWFDCLILIDWLMGMMYDFERWMKCVQSHQNAALVGSYMFLIYSFYLCPYLCPLSRELCNDEA